MASGKYAVSGQFDSSGAATVSVTRTGALSTLTVQLQLQPTNDTALVTGSVTDGSWVAQLLGDKAYYASSSAPQASTYTMTFLTGSTGLNSAGEGSYGLAKVKVNGGVTLTGQMSDGSGLSEATSISKGGVLPLFIPLYKGGGSLLGWLTFTNGPSYELTGTASWIKTAAFGNYYSNGFTNTCTVYGSVRH